ncbi:MAG: hypothetical protein GAK33_03165 [Burkholderia lata]|uniref:Uncharacterized protein n=1 Tax=Burkholderia lata (strain ATCC 17760 / DSM 23089 / LMG 22485 / NCIMB 9086 / R18194 / 383) TaxID=482957 RepID=A0A833PNC6_BURL3|nr:hypothetical protein [Burkholderia lata]KAF1037232.1 MAG: hypothetical protein GAK33_03165 [Burkholderia lata]
MTRAERQDDSPTHPPKLTWGPGKNAALSFVAFAAIFGIFAYAERDTTVGHPSVTHDISGVIGTVVGKTRTAIVTLASRATGASGTGTSATGTSGTGTSATGTSATGTSGTGTSATSAAPEPAPAPAQITPPAPTLQVASTSAAPGVATVPPVTLAVEPEAAPRPAPRADAKHWQSPHAPPVTLAAGTHATSAYGRAATRHGTAHRAQRAEMLAGTSRRMDFAPKPRPYGTDTVHMQTASITRAELESARALAKARSCAVIDEWNCVEQNASRALAIDPKNSESRALLGQAIRNRL